jgi:hypothetical protein
MDDGSVIKWILALSVAAIAATGCGPGQDTVMAHSPSEQKAIDAYKNMTPQQQIDLVEKSPMPDAAKQATIAKIKTKYHIN